MIRPLRRRGKNKDIERYPTYGRGKDPGMEFESYMYNPKLARASSVVGASFESMEFA